MNSSLPLIKLACERDGKILPGPVRVEARRLYLKLKFHIGIFHFTHLVHVIHFVASFLIVHDNLRIHFEIINVLSNTCTIYRSRIVFISLS